MKKRKGQQKENIFTFSKVLSLLSCSVFLICIIAGFCASANSVMDTAVYVAAISISGGVAGTCLLWYMKKAQTENVIKLKTKIYQTATDEKIRYLKETLKIKKELNEEFPDIEIEDVDLNNFVTSALEDLNTSANQSLSEATESIVLQNY